MAEMGISPHTIALILNHVSVRRGTVTAKVYNQYSYDPEKREALEKWGKRLEEIIRGLAKSSFLHTSTRRPEHIIPVYRRISDVGAQ